MSPWGWPIHLTLGSMLTPYKSPAGTKALPATNPNIQVVDTMKLCSYQERCAPSHANLFKCLCCMVDLVLSTHIKSKHWQTSGYISACRSLQERPRRSMMLITVLLVMHIGYRQTRSIVIGGLPGTANWRLWEAKRMWEKGSPSLESRIYKARSPKVKKRLSIKQNPPQNLPYSPKAIKPRKDLASGTNPQRSPKDKEARDIGKVKSTDGLMKRHDTRRHLGNLR